MLSQQAAAAKPHVIDARTDLIESTTSWAGEPRFICDASCIGLRPGQWPATLQAENWAGQGQDVFQLQEMQRDAMGDLCGVKYRQRGGRAVVIVVND